MTKEPIELKHLDVVSRDMRKIYQEIYQKHPEGFPEIIVVDEEALPTRDIILRYHPRYPVNALIVSNDADDDEIIACVCDELDNPSCREAIECRFIPFYDLTEKQVALRLIFASYIADLLDIPLDPVYFSNTVDNQAPYEHYRNVSPYSDTIVMRNSIIEMSYALRINWQAMNFNYFLDKPRYLEDESSYLSETLSIIDKKAFAYKLMSVLDPDNIILPQKHYTWKTPSLYEYELAICIEDIKLDIPKERLEKMLEIYKIGDELSEKW